MIIAIILLFALFIVLEIYSSGKYFGLGTNQFALFIYHSVRIGSLLTAMLLTWFFSQPLFWVLIVLLISLFCIRFIAGNEKRKIKSIVRIYKAMEKSLPPNTSRKSLLKSTAITYYQSLGWNGNEINSIIKTLFDDSIACPDDIGYFLAAWLLVYEYPSVMNRASKRYKIASRFYQESI